MSTRRFAEDARTFDVSAFDGALGATGIRTVARLAKEAGVSRSMLYLVRAGYTPSDEMQGFIARALKLRVQDLWRKVQP